MASNYVRVPLSPEFVAQAATVSAQMQVLPRSHRKGDANLVGLLGEAVAASWLKSRGLSPNIVRKIEHDMELPVGNGRQFHFDVKAKDRTVRPQPDYEATVPAYVYDKQAPDAYLFVSLLRPRDQPLGFTDAFIVGAISRARFDGLKYFEPAGPKPNGAFFFCDAWNIHISELDEPGTFPACCTGT